MNEEAISVIANCQAWPLAQVLSSLSNSQARFISLNDVVSPTSQSHTSTLKIIEEASHSKEIVFTFNAQHSFAPADTSGLKAIFGDRLKTFTNLRFDGTHPDMTYFGRFGGRWHGTMGEYHSKLIIFGFATGRSEVECRSLFTGSVYDQAGFYEIWEQSAQELIERDERCDIKFARTFLELIKTHHCLLTINHPTSVVFHELASLLLKSVGRDARSPGLHSFGNPLYGNFIWPVYPEVGEQFGLPYKMGMNFFRPTTGDHDLFFPRSLTLDELIASEYAFYRKHYDFEQFKEAAAELPFWGRLAEALG